MNATLKVGQASTTVEVEAAPLMNAVDTTNGYVMETQQIDAVPLPTGSFTGLAILSPGVNAELPGGTGSNSGLGNAPIWANGQRDTSNAFLVNGVDASNLFNGKSTSQVDSFRVVNNTGQANNAAGGVIPSASSVYLAIGNAIPTPAPETIAEVRVNASMYDAQQGSDSGAHIDMSTKSGTNQIHGGVYAHRGTNWINAAPFFFKKDDNIPAADKNPELHRYIAGRRFRRPNHQKQALWICRLSAPAYLRPGNGRRASRCSAGLEFWPAQLRDRPECGKPDRCGRKQLDHQYYGYRDQYRRCCPSTPRLGRHIQRLQPRLKSGRLQSVHHAGAARRAGKLSGSERAA